MTEMPHDPQADAVSRPPPEVADAPPARDGAAHPVPGAGPAGAAAGGGLSAGVSTNRGQTTPTPPRLGGAGLGPPAVINLSGVKNMGSVQMITTILKFAALLFVSIVGLFYIKSANFTPWNISGDGAVAAIGAGMAIALFSYLGVEVASVAAGKVRDPDKNVPKSTVLGTLACAVVRSEERRVGKE